jgi:hypothetical protein
MVMIKSLLQELRTLLGFTTLPGITIRNVVATGGACVCAHDRASDVDV